jgi:hypothetical protein
MNSNSEDIKDLLEGESSLGLSFATNLFIAKEPSSPDDCVTIFDTPGGQVDLMPTKGDEYYRGNIQIRVRDNSQASAWELINDIVDFLHNKGNEEINDVKFTVIRCSNSPFQLDWDENNRIRLVTNFELQKIKI